MFSKLRLRTAKRSRRSTNLRGTRNAGAHSVQPQLQSRTLQCRQCHWKLMQVADRVLLRYHARRIEAIAVASLRWHITGEVTERDDSFPTVRGPQAICRKTDKQCAESFLEVSLLIGTSLRTARIKTYLLIVPPARALVDSLEVPTYRCARHGTNCRLPSNLWPIEAPRPDASPGRSSSRPCF